MASSASGWIAVPEKELQARTRRSEEQLQVAKGQVTSRG